MSKKIDIEKIKQDAQAKRKENKAPKRVSFELRTLLGWVGIILLILGAYIAGVMSADVSNKSYNDAVRSEAAALVDQLKSSK